MNWDIDPMFRVIYYPFVSIYQLNCSSFFPIGWSTNWESMNSWCGPRWIIVTCKEIEKITITLITPIFFSLFFTPLVFGLKYYAYMDMLKWWLIRVSVLSYVPPFLRPAPHVLRFFSGEKLDVWYTYIYSSNCLRLQRSKRFLELLQGFHESICVSCEGISNKNG
jgi:hypothetical protein